jgi:hypothetical protein
MKLFKYPNIWYFIKKITKIKYIFSFSFRFQHKNNNNMKIIITTTIYIILNKSKNSPKLENIKIYINSILLNN